MTSLTLKVSLFLIKWLNRKNEKIIHTEEDGEFIAAGIFFDCRLYTYNSDIGPRAALHVCLSKET